MAAERIVIPSLGEVKDHVGKPLGPSEWFSISQERIAVSTAETPFIAQPGLAPSQPPTRKKWRIEPCLTASMTLSATPRTALRPKPTMFDWPERM